MPRFYRCAALGFFLLGAAALAAAEGTASLLEDYRRVTTQGKAVNRLEIDNDSLLLNRDDGFYSSGLRFTREHALREGSQITVFGWRLGQEFYTASDIKLTPPQIGPSNHPYAGWLYGGMFRETRREDGRQWRYGVDLGCLGPCAGGRWTQTRLHALLNQPLPQGWSTQVRDEFGVILYGAMTPLRWKLTSWLDAAPMLHGRLGNIHTDAGAGITVRAGQLPGFADATGLHGYLKLDARAVAWNASLQGGYFSSNNPRTVKPKRAVGEAELGLAWNSGPYGVTGAVVRRSTEIDALSNAQGAQTFVRLLFTYAP
ncbi:lipid A deacylase LpxR family protein [Janthinobacterium sp. 17J80-10]|uniref:lipid A deacylase LpxR family protein n=1 Tax=Janthinobacterium sp. 17J80-10 TaxID=2497863 RepID=UPI001005672D|nr:lipid A deacylase LpxR family protein [Janthinobacterium sp. 17J80-10]QAU35106.1 lipid A deacylase LpxR family protein [Janthinobacterium sp. 17J80-10]